MGNPPISSEVAFLPGQTLSCHTLRIIDGRQDLEHAGRDDDGDDDDVDLVIKMPSLLLLGALRQSGAHRGM